MIIWDVDGRIIEANDAFLRWWDGREDLLAGRMHWTDMTPRQMARRTSAVGHH
jgi:PAS domain-containing protein